MCLIRSYRQRVIIGSVEYNSINVMQSLGEVETLQYFNLILHRVLRGMWDTCKMCFVKLFQSNMMSCMISREYIYIFFSDVVYVNEDVLSLWFPEELIPSYSYSFSSIAPCSHRSLSCALSLTLIIIHTPTWVCQGKLSLHWWCTETAQAQGV